LIDNVDLGPPGLSSKLIRERRDRDRDYRDRRGGGRSRDRRGDRDRDYRPRDRSRDRSRDRGRSRDRDHQSRGALRDPYRGGEVLSDRLYAGYAATAAYGQQSLPPAALHHPHHQPPPLYRGDPRYDAGPAAVYPRGGGRYDPVDPRFPPAPLLTAPLLYEVRPRSPVRMEGGVVGGSSGGRGRSPGAVGRGGATGVGGPPPYERYVENQNFTLNFP
jgi:hypothetical protein